MWMDHRAVAEAADINATRDPALAYVGGEVSVEMELPKVLWLRRHFPERHARCSRYFDLADYLVWRATGADVASVCTLTCKWNYLAHEQRFSKSLLVSVDLLDLLPKVPAEVLPLGSAAGVLTERAAAELGLSAGNASWRPASSTPMPAASRCSVPHRKAGSRSSAEPPAVIWSSAATR